MSKLWHRTYGSPNHNNKREPLDELIFIVLSQMTTGPSFNRVFDRLKSDAGWRDVMEMPLRRLKALIRDAGLSNQKAPRIRRILSRVHADWGSLSLVRLRKMDTPTAEAYLTSLPGVGVKTAKCVLMYSLGRLVLPVDTHIHRAAVRLGLLRDGFTSDRAHLELEKVVVPRD